VRSTTATLLVGVVAILTTGLAEPLPQAIAAAPDASTLLATDQTTDAENDRFLCLVPALGAIVPAQGSRIGGPASQATWPAGHRAVSDLARAPPREPAIPDSFRHRKEIRR
jgi:hypothetical protein